MKKEAYLLLALSLLTAAGCAQKSETEKLGDQFKKAGKEWERDSKKAADQMKRDLAEANNP